MGLSLVVGIMPLLRSEEPDKIPAFTAQFELINKALHHVHTLEHHEPEIDSPTIFDMGDYNNLHYLRRLAAFLCLHEELPAPGDDDAAADPINEKWCIWATNKQPESMLSQILGDRVEAPIPYEHLMVHSDAEGFYVPHPFHRVVIGPKNSGIIGNGLIGSSISIKHDCEQIAGALDLPLDLDPNSEEIQDAIAKQGSYVAAGTWDEYGRESFACLTLYRAALKSIETGAALVFC